MAHTHVFRLARPNGTVELCECGKWRHSAHNTNPVIRNIPATSVGHTHYVDYVYNPETGRYDRKDA